MAIPLAVPTTNTKRLEAEQLGAHGSAAGSGLLVEAAAILGLHGKQIRRGPALVVLIRVAVREVPKSVKHG